MACFLLSEAANAAECYQLLEDPGLANPPAPWTITVNDNWTLTWHQGDTTVELVTGSAGTGIPRRIASNLSTRETYPYLFHKGDLIFDMSIYTPVSCD
jgi:hypothetical protein